jgi:predicted permease
LAPAAHAARVSLWPAIAGHSVPGRLGRGFSVRKSLLVPQVALSVALLIGAALFTRTLTNLRTQDLGLTGDRLLLVWTSPGQTAREGDDLGVLWKTARERIGSLPGVVSVSASAEGLLVSSPAFVGGPRVRPDGAPAADTVMPYTTATVAPRFFETVGQRVLRGRDFSDMDNEAAPAVVILSDSLARRVFAGVDPIGRRVALEGNRRAPSFEVVGIVSDAAHATRARQRAALYYPAGQNSRRLRWMCLAIRTAGDPMGVAPDVRRELRAIDPRLPILNVNSLEDQLDEALALDRLVMDLSVGFAALALALAAAGVYGTLAYAVARRTREIGVRVALGATRRGVLGMVITEGLTLAAGGIAIGVPVALLVTRQIASRLHGVSAADPFSIAAAVTIMTATVIIASVVPARRASGTDPIVALRCE